MKKPKPHVVAKEQLEAVEEELKADAVALGEPEPQDTVETDTAAWLRLGHSNDWQRSEINARVNRAVLSRDPDILKLSSKEREVKISEALKQYTAPMQKALEAIAEIDTLFPEARARAREMIEQQRAAREMIKTNKLTQCPQCGAEYKRE